MLMYYSILLITPSRSLTDASGLPGPGGPSVSGGVQDAFDASCLLGAYEDIGRHGPKWSVCSGASWTLFAL